MTARPPKKFIAYHEAKSKGGWGLIITEDYAVDPRGKGFLNIPGLWDDNQIESHSKLTERVHKYGSKIVAQIYHAGRQTNHYVIGMEPEAPCPYHAHQTRKYPTSLLLMRFIGSSKNSGTAPSEQKRRV